MQQGNQGIRWWLLISAGLMAVGSFGPWAKALAVSVSGTDNSNDGWLVIGCAVIGVVLYLALKGRRSGCFWALLAGVGGAAVTIYDRSNIQDKINSSDVGSLLQVGWGLNLAMIASISLAVAGLAALASAKPQQAPVSAPPEPPPSAPPAPDVPRVASTPPATAPED
jgi:hypothetical protein